MNAAINYIIETANITEPFGCHANTAQLATAIAEIESRMTQRVFTSRHGASRTGRDLFSITKGERISLDLLRREWMSRSSA